MGVIPSQNLLDISRIALGSIVYEYLVGVLAVATGSHHVNVAVAIQDGWHACGKNSVTTIILQDYLQSRR